MLYAPSSGSCLLKQLIGLGQTCLKCGVWKKAQNKSLLRIYFDSFDMIWNAESFGFQNVYTNYQHRCTSSSCMVQ